MDMVDGKARYLFLKARYLFHIDCFLFYNTLMSWVKISKER